ncbi:MAG: PQQ-like beta-propeller repeat protein [Nannocystis sp.]|uniref:PQQ-binding-like beta-propeller repeat protein n=1 Tax=Nannocystis sp. TaxID=1962667 RepID=UPI00242231E7|nr:PQQ-binding-like beta-propeller repeat protein [Nannocystis sp.]MBK9755780.1 PQQ-like beta-propeller repeat protein [Nannocystis sp.]
MLSPPTLELSPPSLLLTLAAPVLASPPVLASAAPVLLAVLVAPVVGSPPVVGSSPLEPVALTPEVALEVGAASVVPTSATDELSELAEVVAPLSLALAPPPPPQPASTTNPHQSYPISHVPVDGQGACAVNWRVRAAGRLTTLPALLAARAVVQASDGSPLWDETLPSMRTVTALAIMADEPAVCGDGILGPEEACDSPDSAGCDATCHLTGEVAWTVTRGGANVFDTPVDVAVGPDGTIVLRVSGWDEVKQEHVGRLLAYDPVAVGDDAVFSASWGASGVSPDDHPPTDGRLHRHDPATGEIVWETVLDGNTPIAQAVAITLSEGTLVAAGEVTAQFPGDGYAFACADAATGTPETCLPGKYTRPTTMLETMPSGDIVVATDASVNEAGLMRRLSREGEILWTFTNMAESGAIDDLAIGPDQRIAVVGQVGEFMAGRGSLRLFTDAGEVAWSLEFPPKGDAQYAAAAAVAFGPGFLVVAGADFTNDGQITLAPQDRSMSSLPAHPQRWHPASRTQPLLHDPRLN